MARPRSISTQTVIDITDGWRVFVTPPDTVTHPEELKTLGDSASVPGEVPGTVVSALDAAGSTALRFASPDDFDVWYTCRFDAPPAEPGGAACLVFDGLATLADVWLNGEPILHSENMFLRHEIDVTAQLRPENHLSIRFSSLNRFLTVRRPRPRWRTKLVDHPQLRWARTTLIGRMPGWHQWAHTIHAVGPWRPVSLVYDRTLAFASADLRATVEETTGVVSAQVRVRPLSGDVSSATLHAGAHQAALDVRADGDGQYILDGTLRIPNVDLWWPHTHGAQPLYDVRVTLTVGEESVTLDFGATGFRTIRVDQTDSGFSIHVNDVPVFCRGACWTTADTARLAARPDALESSLTLARDAGMNMLRVPGNGFYESDDFYDRCARLGIAVWQDFAFALMDYPGADPAFRESVAAEAGQILDRLQSNPALLVLCGNSECESTAAMHGLTADQWANPLFDEVLPLAARRSCPDVPYVPSSQWGGALPFHVNEGVSHYYGVGAYLRPPDDARRSGVRFATECLAFAHVPEDELFEVFLAEGESPGHHPSWKATVPRNVGVGWDFGDVRDHYVKMLWGEDPNVSLYSNIARYLALGRMVTGELMSLAFTEWRRPGSTCRGALVWYLSDIWPGVGWGIIDTTGHPKSSYFYLKRALASRTVFFTDEGLNGLHVHIINEVETPLEARLRIALYRHGQTRIHEQILPVSVAGRGTLTQSVDAVIGHFLDTTYAYRFGPGTQDVTVAVLEMDPDDATPLPAPAFYFPVCPRFLESPDIGVQAMAHSDGNGNYTLNIRAERFAQSVRIEAHGYIPNDNYFHLEPGHEHIVILTPVAAERPPLKGYVTAINALAPTRIMILPK